MRAAGKPKCICMPDIVLPAPRHDKSSRGTPSLRRAPLTLHCTPHLAARTTGSFSLSGTLAADPSARSELCAPSFIRALTLGATCSLLNLLAASGGVLVSLDWSALTPALTEIRLFDWFVPSVGLVASSQRAAPKRTCGLAASWLFNSRRQAHFLLDCHMAVVLMPNVRAKRATTAGRQARVGENVPRTASPGLVACRWRSA